MRTAFVSVRALHTLAIEDRTGHRDRIIDAIDAAVHTTPRPVAVAGVSLGAHAAAAWAATSGHDRVDALGLVMPAWLGRPDAVASLSVTTAERVRTTGLDTLLAQIRAEAPDRWEVEDLQIDWPDYGDHLAPALAAAGHSPAPTLADLARITVPCGVVALRDDPLHPASVARAWAAALPRARLITLGRSAPGAHRSVLGAAAQAGWRLAAQSADPSGVAT